MYPSRRRFLILDCKRLAWTLISVVRSSFVGDYFACIENLVHDLGQKFIAGEIFVIELGVLCRVNPTEVLHATELLNSLRNEISEA